MAEGNRGIRKKSEKRNSGDLRGFRRRFLALLVCLVTVLGSLTACGGGTRVVFTTGFGKDEVFRIADESCTRAEIMVYLTTTQNRYESVYGPEVWNIAKDGVTLEENVKETVLAKIAQIKTMCLLAEKEGVELDEAESGLAADWQDRRTIEKTISSFKQHSIRDGNNPSRIFFVQNRIMFPK